MFSKQFGSSDLHTFYIFFFLERKIAALPTMLDEMYEQLGVSVGIHSDYFRPSLWQLSFFPRRRKCKMCANRTTRIAL
ncbi:MAG: hypothetical protein ACKPKO_09950, partial [Candidatus Fonsibacter sp.]